MDELDQSVRFYFDTVEAAARGLIVVLVDARSSEVYYEFSPLSAAQIVMSGLSIRGKISGISSKLGKIPGALRHNE